ncbi:MAG: hypothetical protein OES57_11705, partial [Acidimicrobiia bacterium]|nr:hypothetical protein [Acidimicrobiia bacterium]
MAVLLIALAAALLSPVGANAQPAEPAGDDADHHRALLSAFETQRRSDEVAPTDIAVDELEATVASDTEPQERA